MLYKIYLSTELWTIIHFSNCITKSLKSGETLFLIEENFSGEMETSDNYLLLIQNKTFFFLYIYLISLKSFKLFTVVGREGCFRKKVIEIYFYFLCGICQDMGGRFSSLVASWQSHLLEYCNEIFQILSKILKFLHLCSQFPNSQPFTDNVANLYYMQGWN